MRVFDACLNGFGFNARGVRAQSHTPEAILKDRNDGLAVPIEFARHAIAENVRVVLRAEGTQLQEELRSVSRDRRRRIAIGDCL